MKIKVSIITINYNESNALKRTIDSVSSQKKCDFEYVVVDGGSCDESVQVIKSNAHVVDIYISEPDSGIYNAMNKGMELASGEYILYLNSGDVFSDAYVVKKIIDVLSLINGFDAYYGHAKVDDNKEKRVSTIEKYWKTMFYCHQSLLLRRSIALQYKFDESYSIAADFEQSIRLHAHGVRFRPLDFVVACISSGGVSDTKRWLSISQRIKALKSNRLWKKHYYLYYAWVYFYNFAISGVKFFLRK
ncbi:glycosyltransferase [Vibrio genomosp. F6]|uniref:glycosyltransferase family 2 protein n=1 Tax=Vibrio genomosp. F6 TaxID=723172 RepID=UPI0010BD06B8|nr:glycosyltransferase family 2 protein [Vibrio genomosp. F6]TKF23443.1 glycosyltransferase [Vibrio genomosp. F6]